VTKLSQVDDAVAVSVHFFDEALALFKREGEPCQHPGGLSEVLCTNHVVVVAVDLIKNL